MKRSSPAVAGIDLQWELLAVVHSISPGVSFFSLKQPANKCSVFTGLALWYRILRRLLSRHFAWLVIFALCLRFASRHLCPRFSRFSVSLLAKTCSTVGSSFRLALVFLILSFDFSASISYYLLARSLSLAFFLACFSGLFLCTLRIEFFVLLFRVEVLRYFPTCHPSFLPLARRVDCNACKGHYGISDIYHFSQ